MATITINGRAVEAEVGAPLVEVIKNAGFPISNLCYLDGLPPYAGCRTCAVEVEGMRGLPLSCTTTVMDGMVVRTDTPEVTEMRQEVLAVILANHSDRCLTCHRIEHCRTGEICLRDNEVTHRCVTCSKNYRCELQTTCDAADVGRANVEPYIDEARTYYRHQQPEPDRANPFFEFDPQMCIICTRCVRACDDLRHTTAITLAGRGFSTMIAFGAGGRIDESNCDFCGSCVDVCPTATLMEAPNKWVARPDKWVTTTCTECSMGCTIQMGVRDGRGVQVRPGNGNDVSRSQICVRGRFGYDQTRDKDRLRAASIGRGEDAFEQDGDAVAEHAAAAISAILAEHGPSAVGILGSGQMTLEELYALRTLATRLGITNLDSSLGPVTAAVGAALTDAFGSEHLPSRLTSVETADLIIAMGDDISASNNVLGVRIKDAVANNGASLVSISSRRNPLADYAVDEAHAIHPADGDLASVAQAIATNVVKDLDVRTGLSDVDGLSDVSGSADGVEASSVTALRRRGGAVAIVVAPSRTNAAQAGAQVRAAANLAIALAGPADAPASLHVLPPESNSVGLRDLGVVPGEAGLDVSSMLKAAQEGTVKALIVARDNPVMLHPDHTATIAALENLDVLVVIDEVATQTVQLATHVLPDASAFGKDGHITNADRQILRLRTATIDQRNARPLGLWLAALAAHLPAVDTPTTNEDGEPGSPIPAPEQPQNVGEARTALAGVDSRYSALLEAGASQSRMAINGAATQRFLSVEATGAANGDGSLTLLSGRDLYSDRLSAARGEVNADLLQRSDTVQINPGDAASLGIEDGAVVILTRNDSRISLAAEITEDVPSGAVWVSALHEHGAVQELQSAGANRLASVQIEVAG
ncbi:MAG: molybdopterin-dependent oxidoreductase [Chloroflexi bacterium]|nr:molybdopterin-dependent oxidoreductase [Chloroflexota bacterium]MYJ92800.1 molybdopterin-dependent oxidoreductase [Chloroflexota bacterium]